MPYESYIVLVCVILSVTICVWNIYLFLHIQPPWKWIKLVYAVNTGIASIYLIFSIPNPKVHAMLFVILLLLMTMIGGTATSATKLYGVKRTQETNEES